MKRFSIYPVFTILVMITFYMTNNVAHADSLTVDTTVTITNDTIFDDLLVI